MIAEELLKGVLLHQANLYDDNHDLYRFGKLSFKKRVRLTLLKILKRLKLYHLTDGREKTKNHLTDNIRHFDFLYERLENSDSKQLLVQILLYRLLGEFRYKLRLAKPDYFDSVTKVRSHRISDEFVLAGGLGGQMKLFKYDLQKAGFDIKIYLSEHGLVADFIWKQYEYSKEQVQIKAKPGDFVIDAGGCYGDTALYFSEMVGDSGKVYSFEFIPNNLSLFETNLALNPSLRNRIDVIEQPLWDQDSISLYYEDRGPASKVSFVHFDNSESVLTCSIDGFVSRQKLAKVDFIKMDIEGAELNALKGASRTIRNFKPKLAISLYHNLSDFGDIPRLILELNPSYQLYLSHFTIHSEETILFAIDGAAV